MKNARRKTEEDVVDGPAVIGADHAQGRVLSTRAGAKKGWSRLTVYERVFQRGVLICKERCSGAVATREEEGRALDRFAAARAFDEGWQVCNAGFPGGVDFDRVRTSGGVPGAFVDHQRDAKSFWRRVEQGMGPNDWQICRLVCGENHSVAEAVATISPDYKASTLARFREALDSLVGAMAAARRKARDGGPK